MTKSGVWVQLKVTEYLYTLTEFFSKKCVYSKEQSFLTFLKRKKNVYEAVLVKELYHFLQIHVFVKFSTNHVECKHECIVQINLKWTSMKNTVLSILTKLF